MGMVRRRLRIAAGMLAVLVLGACVASYRNHGYIPPDDLLDEIVVGIDTRASVEDNVGSPTSGGILNDSGYYYVRSRFRNFAYRAPEEIERQVLAISFDDTGVVSNIERFELEDGKVVVLQRRVTETSVVDRSFIRQLLSSFGRIAPTGL